jgi:hypothetical protein
MTTRSLRGTVSDRQVKEDFVQDRLLAETQKEILKELKLINLYNSLDRDADLRSEVDNYGNT